MEDGVKSTDSSVALKSQHWLEHYCCEFEVYRVMMLNLLEICVGVKQFPEHYYEDLRSDDRLLTGKGFKLPSSSMRPKEASETDCDRAPLFAALGFFPQNEKSSINPYLILRPGHEK